MPQNTKQNIPPPCPRTALRKNRPLVPRSNSRIIFFYCSIGFFMVLVDAGQLFRCAGQHFMCVATGPPIRGDPISQSQVHIPLKPLPPALGPFVWKGKPNSRVHQEVQKNKITHIAQTMQANAKTDVKVMLHIVIGEGAHAPAQCAGKIFSAVRGCPRSCARTNPWFRGRILGGKRAQEPPPGSAVKHCWFLGTGGKVHPEP